MSNTAYSQHLQATFVKRVHQTASELRETADAIERLSDIVPNDPRFLDSTGTYSQAAERIVELVSQLGANLHLGQLTREAALADIVPLIETKES